MNKQDADWLSMVASNIRLSRSQGAHPLSWMARVVEHEREARAAFGDEVVDAAITEDRAT